MHKVMMLPGERKSAERKEKIKKKIAGAAKQVGRGIDKRVKSSTQRIDKEFGHRKLQLGKVKKGKHKKYQSLF